MALRWACTSWATVTEESPGIWKKIVEKAML